MKKIVSFICVTVLLFALCTASFTASAPPLTQLGMYVVESAQGGAEYITSSTQFSTVNDHGGNPFYIYTYEIGYSQNRIAKLNGSMLNQVGSQAIDLNGDSIIDGYYRIWDASGHTGGTFTYQATSINSPWNTMSTSIYIQ